MNLERLVPADADVLIDTSALLTYLAGDEPASPAATAVFDRLILSQRNRGVLSAITATEMLVHPFRKDAVDDVLPVLLDHPGLVLRPVDFPVAAEAARMRSRHPVSLGDALILATGVMSSCACVVTNDRALAKAARTVVPEMAVCLLSELNSG